LQANPTDANGWYQLGRLMLSVPLLDRADMAFQRALDHDSTNISYAMNVIQLDAQRNNGGAGPTSQRAVLQLQMAGADRVKTEMLAGLVALRSGQLDKAETIWSELLKTLDNPVDRAPVEQSLSVVRERKALLQAKAANEKADVEEGSPRHIIVNVRIPESIEITESMKLFVTVKAQDGPPMPLAVRSFASFSPNLSLTLTTADAMTPQMSLNTFDQVKVEALLSHTGVASRAKGDWVSQPALVDFSQKGSRSVGVVVDQMVE